MSPWADNDAVTERDPNDPYATLGVVPTATDAELRRAYHRLAKLHHPDHNGGSELAARRFSEIQAAHSLILRLRRESASRPGPARTPERDGAATHSPRRAWAEPWLDERIAAFERDYAARRDPRSETEMPPPRPRTADNSLRSRLTDLFGNS